MGSPSRTRLQSRRHFSWWGPSLPWLLQPQRLRLRLMLIRGTATDIVAMDTADTTGLMATMVTTERGLPMPSQSPLRPLTLTLMLMLGTDTMATDTVAGDTVATTGPMATMATMERGLQMLSLKLLLLLIPLLMLMPGTATTATVAGDTVATTAHMDMGVTGEVTGAMQTNREVDSSSDCDFPSTLASISRACS